MSKRKNFSVDDLWALERLGAPTLSPDGQWAVAALASPSMARNTTSHALWLFPTAPSAKHAARRLTQAGDKDGSPQFAPQGDSLAFIAKRDQEGRKDDEPQIYILPTEGGEARRAATVATGVEAFKWFPNGERMAVLSWVWPDARGTKAQAKRHKAFAERKETGYVTTETAYRYWDSNLPMGRVAHLHVLDLKRGKLHDLFEGSDFELTRADPDSQCFDVSPTSDRVVFAYDPGEVKRLDNHQALAEVDLKSGRIHTVLKHADWDFSHPVYSPDGAHIACLGAHLGRSPLAPAQLVILNRASKAWHVASARWDRECEGPLVWQADGRSLNLLAEELGRRHVWRFDLKSRQATIVEAGGWVESFDSNAHGVVSVKNSAMHPGQLRFGAARADTSVPSQRIDSFNDEILNKRELARVEERWFKGALGEPVQLWLSFPAAMQRKKGSPKKWPLMHMIHGGPHTTFGDAWHFRWNTQVFAAEGYVVAAVNYHGSTSFGFKFKRSIAQRLGELELQDVEAATTVLLKEPWVDKKRVYATGGSYGGYMAAWMNGRVKPGRYAAYVCHAGCYDWAAMMADDAYTWFPKELGAWHWDNPKKVASQSPITYAANFKTPTLVIHGALDYRVPDAQGLAYYNTLKAQGIEARLLWYPDENHWILKPRNSQQWYGEFLAWLAKKR